FSLADAKGLPVAAHALTSWGFNRVTRFPVHSLEHMVADRELTDEQARRVGDLKAFVVPTLHLAMTCLVEEAYDELPPEYDTEFIHELLALRREELLPWPKGLLPRGFHGNNILALKKFGECPRQDMPGKNIYLVRPEVFFDMALRCRANLAKLVQAGVTVGAGMDAGLPFSYFGQLHLELEMLHRAGLSRAEVLRAATANNSKILGISDKVGSLAPGKLADLVVLEKNPLDDILAYRTPRLVFKEGVLAHSA
ncbi:MAG: amidohydrolase family protein, partial [Pseudomonadota bacterium]